MNGLFAKLAITELRARQVCCRVAGATVLQLRGGASLPQARTRSAGGRLPVHAAAHSLPLPFVDC